jgi:hypothetical protein
MIGMVRSPRATLTSAIARPQSLNLALLILVIGSVCNAGFLMTRVGQLAALDQQVRQLESFGAVVDDQTYADLRGLVPYRPALAVATVLVGWPALWLIAAFVLHALGTRLADVGARPSLSPGRATFAQVLTVVVHASSVFAVRALIAAPVNYARESLGGATSLSMLLPSFGESTFPARLFGAVDVFAVWWVALAAMGLGILYQTRAVPIARWMFAAYGVAAMALALAQVLRGGV